jgi:16S rRNA (cytosine967-C5)-methyltransferase
MGDKNPARVAAFDALLEWETGKEAIEALRERAFARRRLSPADRALALEMTQGILRHRLLLDHRIDALLTPAARPRRPRALKAPVRVALRLGLYQILFLQKIPSHAAVNETVELLRDTPFGGFVPLANAVLRRALTEPAPPVPDRESDPAGNLSFSTSTPRWLVDRLAAQWGWEEARALLAALNRPASTALRVNTLRASRGRVLERLRAEGVEGRAGALSPDAVVLPEGCGSPAALAVFREGLATVQDQGAQLVAPLLGARAGETVLDACAAPGGKAGHLAQLMEDRGMVLAADVSPARCRMTRSALERLGFRSVHLFAADLAGPRVLVRPLDRVLLDAPCTGTGVLRRHPEGKWRKDPAGIPALVARQEGLLQSCAALLRPGGRLLYTTCSLLREENEEVVDRFLARADHARVPFDGASPGLPPGTVTGRGEFRAWPHRHDCDGFFAALLERR